LLRADRELDLLAEQSTRPIAQIVTHAGICKVIEYDLRAPPYIPDSTPPTLASSFWPPDPASSDSTKWPVNLIIPRFGAAGITIPPRLSPGALAFKG